MGIVLEAAVTMDVVGMEYLTGQPMAGTKEAIAWWLSWSYLYTACIHENHLLLTKLDFFFTPNLRNIQNL